MKFISCVWPVPEFVLSSCDPFKKMKSVDNAGTVSDPTFPFDTVTAGVVVIPVCANNAYLDKVE
jgi:hypothetical protein